MASFYYISKERGEKHYTLKECTDDGSTYTIKEYPNITDAKDAAETNNYMLFINRDGSVGVMRTCEEFLDAMCDCKERAAKEKEEYQMKHAGEEVHRYVIKTPSYSVSAADVVNRMPKDIEYSAPDPSQDFGICQFLMTESEMKKLIDDLRKVEAVPID